MKYIQNRQFANAVQAFQEAYLADPADIEIINNLGHAHMKNGDLDVAEQFLFQALAISPDRSSAWADLGQTYAKQGKTTASVACFANAYRFSRDQNQAYQFLHKLAEEDDNAKVRNAATKALQLEPVRASKGEPPSSPLVKNPAREERPPEIHIDEFPLGTYRVMRSTRLFREPRIDADPITWLREGTRVNVIGVTEGEWLRVESSRSDKPPGYLRREDAVPIR